MNLPRHFIWDFDGMLFDTYPHTLAAFLEACRRMGISADANEAYALMRVNLRCVYARYGLTEEQVARFYEVENDLDFLPRGVPFPGVPGLLAFIKENGGRNYLYTHRDKVALRYLELYGLTGLFTDCVTAENGFPYKPAPDALEDLAARFALPKGECLMLGDRDIDIGAGVNAGMPTLLFDTERRYPGPIGETYRCDSAAALEQQIRAFFD